MKTNKSCSTKPRIFNKISKSGILENDKRHLIKKFGFMNISTSHSTVREDIIHNLLSFSGNNTKSVSSIKTDPNFYKSIALKNQFSVNSENSMILGEITEYQDKKKIHKNAKSYSVLPNIKKVSINLMEKKNYKKIEKNYNIAISKKHSPSSHSKCKIKKVINNKTKNNIINMSTPNLIPNNSKPIIKKNKLKEKSHFDIDNLINKNRTTQHIRKKKMINMNKKLIINSLLNHNLEKKTEPPKNLLQIEDENKSNISISNENSSDTRKENGLNLQKIFTSKIVGTSPTDKKNLINDIINSNINKNKKIIENEEENNNLHTKRISFVSLEKIKEQISKNDTDNGNEINHTENLENSEYDLKNSKQNFNFDNDDENIENNNAMQRKNKYEESSFKSQNLICNNKFFEFNNNIIEPEKISDQEFPESQDKNSGQTQTTIEKNNKLSRYLKQPYYNISPRFNSEEISLINNHILPNKTFKFINEIEIENNNIPIIDIKKFLKLNYKSVINLLSFCYDNYNNITKSNNLINVKINKCLKTTFQHVIEDFKLKYGNFLNLTDYYFQQKSTSLNHKTNNLFNLVIKCEIITKEILNSYEIGCNYLSNSKKYDYFWKFDVRRKKDINIWICTELDIINNIYKKFTYSSQVSSFSYGDEIELQFNIFSKGNCIDSLTVEWTDPVITKSPTSVYENSRFISKISFDQLRACEVETQILFWKNDLPKDEKDKKILEDFKEIYKKNFKITSIKFDISKFYFYKIQMIAEKEGIIKQNKFSTFDLNIIKFDQPLKNEIQCVYLMNSNYYTNKMDVRKGTKVIFYLVDMKK